MRRSRVVLGILTLTLVVVISTPAANLALAPGDDAPYLRGYTQEGGRIVADFGANKLTLVNFWATWCEPCRDEMPALDELYRKHRKSGFEIIGVLKENIMDEPLNAFIEEIAVKYTLIRPDRRVDQAWGGIGTLPTSFLIDGRGKVLRRYVGATPEQIEGLKFDVAAALKGKPLGPFVMPETSNAVTDSDRPKQKADPRN